MKELILIKLGEMVLKGLNKRTFEDALKKNLKYALKPLGTFTITSAQSTLYVQTDDDTIDLDEACDRISKVFGIVTFSRACIMEKDMEDIVAKSIEYLEDALMGAKTFKVEAKRSDKKFPLKSPEICRDLGGALLTAYPHLTVDVHNPDVTVIAEIRDFGAYVHANVIKGAGGVPVGTSGRAAILISGGIDSPVAAYMMAKRGLRLTAIHFASPPYTSPQAEDKVNRLLEKVACYSGSLTEFTVPFTKIQERIKERCPEELFTIIMRRLMMKISCIIADNNDCGALITGESLGQVASQTMGAIECTQEASTKVIFRPLIGMDKEEIVRISRQIDAFDISIEPYEDCCTVFTPKHPRTKPKLKFVLQAEEKGDFDQLLQEAVENVKMTYIKP